MRKRTDLLAKLRSLAIFSECTDDELRRLDALADEITVSAGRELIRQGELGREFIIIEEGEAAVTRDGEPVASLGPGDHFGELALLTSLERNATVTAVTDMTIQVMDRRGFQTVLEDSPALTLSLLKATAQRLAELDEENSHLRHP